MDASARSPQAGRYGCAGTGWVAAVVQSDAGRGHTPRRVPQSHGGAPAAVSRLDTRAHSCATGPFSFAPQTGAAALGPFGSNGGLVGSGLFECCGSVHGARVGSPTGGLYAGSPWGARCE